MTDEERKRFDEGVSALGGAIEGMRDLPPEDRLPFILRLRRILSGRENEDDQEGKGGQDDG